MTDRATLLELLEKTYVILAAERERHKPGSSIDDMLRDLGAAIYHARFRLKVWSEDETRRQMSVL